MADFILAGVLIWLAVFVAIGSNLVLRPGRRERVAGATLVALGFVPGVIALLSA
jgi:hypothetical protein